MNAIELLQLVGETMAKGALLLLVAAAGARVLRRRSAAGRYAIWGSAFIGLLLLPALAISLPVLQPPALTLPVQTTGATGAGRGLGLRSGVPRTVEPAGPRETGRLALRAGTAARMAMDVSISTGRRAHGGSAWRAGVRAAAPWLLGIWLLGAFGVLGLLARDVRRISHVTRRAARLRRGTLHDLAVEVAAELGLRRPVPVALTRELSVPVSWGFLRPVVLLPAAARHWDADRRRVVLRHELAHVRRGDYAGHLLIELACALHWPNPFAWRAARRARLEQEQACDDRVLGLGTASVDYAQHLLDIARAFGTPAIPARGALAMAAAATLPERMRSILDLGLDHRPAGRRTVLAVAAAAVVFGLPTAAAHPWHDTRREAALLAQLGSPDPGLRREAAWGLGSRGGRTGRPVRLALARTLRDQDAATRGVAAWAMGKVGGHDEVVPLIATLRDPDSLVREMAVLALGELGDDRAVPALAPLGADPEHGVRSVMTVALRDIGGESAVQALARLARRDPDAHTRVMAVCALGQLHSRWGTLALEAALTDTVPEVRSVAAEALSTADSRQAASSLLAALAQETDADVAGNMVRALATSRDPRVVSGLVRVLADTLPRLRETAAHVLGAIGDERAAGPLIAATRDPDHRVRLTAVRALDALEASR